MPTSRSPTRALLLALLALGVATCVHAGETAAPADTADAAPKVPSKGDVPPAYIGETLEGVPVELTTHAGQAVVITFWASWCTYCKKELPVLAELQRAAGKDHLRVIAVDTESREMFHKVMRALGSFDMQLAYDPQKKGQRAFGVSGIPHLVIVGRDGRIDKVFRGYGEDSLDEILASINRATGATE
jgi:thiol-disulfide isomerase/thioredoxin